MSLFPWSSCNLRAVRRKKNCKILRHEGDDQEGRTRDYAVIILLFLQEKEKEREESGIILTSGRFPQKMEEEIVCNRW
jgi:hypothetical protein